MQRINRERIIKESKRLVKEISPFCSRVEIVGSIRRNTEDIKDIDIILIPRNFSLVRDFIINKYGTPYRDGKKIISFKTKLCKIDFYFATEDNWGAMLLTFTGDDKYNIGLRRLARDKFGFKLNQYGLFKGKECIASKTEEEIYKALGKQWKIPELRGK